MKRILLGFVAGAVAAVGVGFALMSAGRSAEPVADGAAMAALRAKVTELEQRLPPPELGRQMLELQIRHDRLWWAGDAGNWNLAYYMVSELGEALRDIEQTNGDAAELQPEKLSDVMPAIMNPAVRGVQDALAKKGRAEFAAAYDKLSAACNACHAKAGVDFLHIQRPQVPLLDNLRYEPRGSSR